MPVMRLDRFFSSQDILTRKEVKSFVKLGMIQVNRTPASSPEQRIDTEKDQISLNGNGVPYEPYLYLMLNKPQGVVSATEDARNPTVLDLVPPEYFRSGLFPAGRLDKDTVGFVLLTNDGDFAHEILSPKKHVPKTYLVRLDGPLTPKGIRRLEQGIELADGSLCQPAEVVLREDGTEPLCEMVLREGKYHQIKRMFGVLDLGVIWLKRTKIGELCLDENLAEGGCRKILHKEKEKILCIYTSPVE